MQEIVRPECQAFRTQTPQSIREEGLFQLDVNLCLCLDGMYISLCYSPSSTTRCPSRSVRFWSVVSSTVSLQISILNARLANFRTAQNLSFYSCLSIVESFWNSRHSTYRTYSEIRFIHACKILYSLKLQTLKRMVCALTRSIRKWKWCSLSLLLYLRTFLLLFILRLKK